MEKRIKKSFFILLFFLFAIGFFIRYFPVRTGYHYWDEAVYLQHAKIMHEEIPSDNYNEFDIRPPLLPILLLLGRIVSPSYIMAHFIVSFISSLGIIFIFFLGKEVFDGRIGFLSSFIYTFLPLDIWLSHDILVDTLLPTFWILIFLFSLKSIKSKKKIFAVFTGIFLGLTFLLKFTSVILPFFVLLLFFIYNYSEIESKMKKRGKIIEKIKDSIVSLIKNKQLWIICIITFLVILPYLAWETLYFGNPFYSIFLGYLVVNWDTPTSIFSLIIDFYKLFPLVLILGILLLLIFLRREKQIKKEVLFFLIVVALFFLSISTLVHKEIRFLLPISPILVILSAAGFIKSKEMLKEKILFYNMIAMLLIIVISLSPLLYYFGSNNFSNLIKGDFIIYEKNDFMEVAYWLKDNISKEEIIYVNTQYPVLAYFSERKIKVLPFYKSFQDELEEVMQENGYYVLFEEVSKTREPTLDFVKNNSNFILLKQFGNPGNNIWVYNFTLKG